MGDRLGIPSVVGLCFAEMIQHTQLSSNLYFFLYLLFSYNNPYITYDHTNDRLRSYHVENTGSRPITEVKQRQARLVLGWETAWEYQVL